MSHYGYNPFGEFLDQVVTLPEALEGTSRGAAPSNMAAQGPGKSAQKHSTAIARQVQKQLSFPWNSIVNLGRNEALITDGPQTGFLGSIASKPLDYRVQLEMLCDKNHNFEAYVTIIIARQPDGTKIDITKVQSKADSYHYLRIALRPHTLDRVDAIWYDEPNDWDLTIPKQYVEGRPAHEKVLCMRFQLNELFFLEPETIRSQALSPWDSCTGDFAHLGPFLRSFLISPRTAIWTCCPVSPDKHDFIERGFCYFQTAVKYKIRSLEQYYEDQGYDVEAAINPLTPGHDIAGSVRTNPQG